MSRHVGNTDVLSDEGRWTVTPSAAAPPAAPAKQPPYEAPRVITQKTKLISPEQLARGYETVDDEGRIVRRDYFLLFHVVKDPDDSAEPPAPDMRP